MTRRLVRSLVVVLASGALLATVGATSVSAADYPQKIENAFQKSCVKAAKKQGAAANKAKAYCRSAFDCIEDKLSLKQFKELSKSSSKFTSNKKVKGCIEKAAAELE